MKAEVRNGRPVRIATLAMAILATFAIELAIAEPGHPPLAVLASAAAFPPALGQGAQQGGPAPRDVHQPQRLQPRRPVLQGDGQEAGADFPVPRQLAGYEAVEPTGSAHLLDGQTVEEAGERVGEVERGRGVQRAFQQVLVLDDQPGQLEPAAQRAYSRRKIERQVAGLERRLALLQIAQRADLGQQHGLPAGRGDERLGQRASAATGGHEHHRVGERLRPVLRERGVEARGEVGDERAVRGDGAPARTPARQTAPPARPGRRRTGPESSPLPPRPKPRLGVVKVGGAGDVDDLGVGDRAEQPTLAG